MNVPNLPLKVVFFVHFVFSVWSIQGSWLPASYLFYNLMFLVMLLWGMHTRESEEPIFMALVVDLLSIILDSITIGVYFPTIGEHHALRFSVGLSILNLICRPVSAVLLLRIHNERSGRYSNFGIPGLGFGRGPYEDIDQPVPQSVPKTPVDTGSPSHHNQLPDALISNQYAPSPYKE